MSSAEHPRAELLAGYRLGLLQPDELREVDAHLEACEACRERVGREMGIDAMALDVRSALRIPRRPLLQRVVPYALAASVLLAGGLSLLFASRRAAHDGAPREADAVSAALAKGKLPLPSFLDTLAPRREVLMGEAPARRAVLLSPAATAVLARAPHFRWERLAADWRFEVRVFTLAGAEAARSPSLSEPSWTCDRALAPADYEWQVTASRGDEKVVLPEPPATPPRFRVLGVAAAERLRRLASQRPSDHLLLGVEYARAGAVEDARRELETALREEPSRADIQKLVASLGTGAR